MSPQYMAGMADADGSFSVVVRHMKRPHPNFHCCFQLTWKASDEAIQVIQKFKDEYGGSFHINIRKANQFGPEIRIVKLYIQGKDLDLFLEKVGPFVVLKRAQVDLLLEVRTLTSKGSDKAESDWHRLYEIKSKMRELNSKNGKGR